MIKAGYQHQPTEIEPSELHFEQAEKLALLWAQGELPQAEVEPDSAFVARRYNELVEPEEMTIQERKLFEANPLDFDWYQKKFKPLPAYLTRYFVNRYISIFNKSGRHAANTFLRDKMKPAEVRVRMVMDKYKRLPNTHKMALLREDDDSEQSDFKSNQQMKFDFERMEDNAKPAKAKVLAELEVDELKDMAFRLSVLANKKLDLLAEEYACENDDELEEVIPEVYEELADFVMQFGLIPPRKYKKQNAESASTDILKIRDEKWWLRRLKKVRKIMREHLAIAMGQVSSKASPYCSWDCVREHKAQQKENWEAILNMVLWDELTDEEFELKDMVLKSQANPAIRRHELMVRTRGCEDIANAMGLQGLFLTLTAPSKYHNTYKRGGFIPHWNGASPADTQRYLNHVWQLIRTKLSNEDLRWFGVRVAEPHHDGTPHWHLLIWVKPEEVDQVRDIFISYATTEDRAELHPEYEKEKKKPFRKCQYVGPMDYRPRCDVGFIDPKKGTATGYIAKYISKNIDGYAMDDEVSDETGKPVKDMAKHVSAWKSRWNLRQFQFFGGAPVTTYRELRRYANLDKASFLNYLTMLKRDQMLNIYEELEVKTGRDLIGPPIPVEIINSSKKYDSKYLFILLSQVYQPSIESNNGDVVKTMQAADTGNWHDYIMGQGGPFVKRKDLLIRNVYETLEYASPHGEDIKKLQGFEAFGEEYKTRTRVWTILPRSGAKPEHKKEVTYEFDKPTDDPSTWKFTKRVVTFNKNDDVNAPANGSEATEIGASGSSRSSVNNCTEELREQVTSQVSRLTIPYEKWLENPPDYDDPAIDAFIKGSSLKLEDGSSIQIRPAELDEHGNIRPAQLIEVKESEDNLSWLEFESWDELFDQPEPEEDEYQQPELSLF
ncbi:replication endonuclease [Vibrio sp. JC009]|uniref:replication endonuclease n=1 Tax=Vibrio sp. JC009 TaxID=2912314 RepID=UPI0023AFB57C|nr:replication endonuclease [Vibrio sp. JC009]WED23494.1 replication endonuclease [Vibrio sp. JC009]